MKSVVALKDRLSGGNKTFQTANHSELQVMLFQGFMKKPTEGLPRDRPMIKAEVTEFQKPDVSQDAAVQHWAASW